MDNIVNVFVGEEEQLFQVHGIILRSNSQFFAAALKECWTEGKAKEVRLPEEDHAISNQYIHYVYSGILACKGANAEDDYEILSNLYALGTRLMDHDLKDPVLDAFAATWNERRRVKDADQNETYPHLHAVNVIYNATSEGSPGRRLLVDVFAIHGKSAMKIFQDAQHDERPHPEFLPDLVKGLMDKRPTPTGVVCAFSDQVGCKYHHHDEEGNQCRAKRRRLR